MIPEFHGFQKIPRLNRPIIITEKIDGTNALIYIAKDGEIFTGSRKRWITPEADNFGFAAWVREHRVELMHLGPGHHFGEWWGRGIQRGYGLDHRRFSLFNVSRWFDPTIECGVIPPTGLEEKWICRAQVPACCNVVPVLYMGPWDMEDHWVEDCCAVEDAVERLGDTGSRAAPGFEFPEGVVVFHTASNHLYKVTLENDDVPKGGARAE